jgi:hypothetical protein
VHLVAIRCCIITVDRRSRFFNLYPLLLVIARQISLRACVGVWSTWSICNLLATLYISLINHFDSVTVSHSVFKYLAFLRARSICITCNNNRLLIVNGIGTKAMIAFSVSQGNLSRYNLLKKIFFNMLFSFNHSTCSSSNHIANHSHKLSHSFLQLFHFRKPDSTDSCCLSYSIRR